MDLTIKNITKVEGHCHLTVKIRNKKVVFSRLSVKEHQRFFESMVKGKRFEEVPSIVSRICGFCSANHVLASIEAIERVFQVLVSPQTKLMRYLLLNGTLIRSHSLHLFFLALPDYFGKDSILDFNKKEHEEIHRGLRLKKAGSDLIKCFGGRAIHPVTPRIGGFTKIPKKEEISRLIKELEKARKDALETVKLFHGFKEKPLHRKTQFVALTNEDYTFLDGEIQSSKGICIPEAQYLKYLNEFVVPYSTAKEAEFAGEEFFVGAISRYNLNNQSLHKDTKKVLKRLKVSSSLESPYLNNLAQAIEVLHAIDQSISFLNEFTPRKEALPNVKPCEGTGIGVLEAPRGTLFHSYSFNKKGVCLDSNIIVPTNQNVRNMNKDIRTHLQEMINEPKTKIRLELEKLIRAYDPCFSCSSHFLKIKYV
jgi:coenzyme F420-reducing hydrogenase alpha subunit